MTPDDKPDPFQDKTGRKPPYTIPNDADADGQVFSDIEMPGPAKNETRYRYSPEMDRSVMEESYHYHEPGDSPVFIDFGAITLEKGGKVYPDAVGTGEGEATPYSAQRGEMPEGEGGKMLSKATGGFVQAAKPVKSDVPANR